MRHNAQDGYWQAVIGRDARFDGLFVYAVRSTGVYCRPSCPARRPRREQVLFFAQPDAAGRAGFRPCRRCRPMAPSADAHAEAVRRVCRYIESNLDGPLTLSALGSQAGLSPYHLQRVFRRSTGMTPREYADICRVSAFKAGVRQGRTVSAALYEAGYGSSSRLYERASARLGMTPATYRSGGRGLRIAYATAPCPLGRLLVGTTPRGICTVKLGDFDAALEAALRCEFPAAEIGRDPAGLKSAVETLLRHLDGAQPDLRLPLDVRATAFQWKVWRELSKIPYGSTRSYQQVARALGQLGAARAVARACAQNPVALVVPCHRVVRSDGEPGGYRWGARRKQALLAREAPKPRGGRAPNRPAPRVTTRQRS